MKRIWRRLLTRPLLIASLGIVGFIACAFVFPSMFDGIAMLDQVSFLSMKIAPFLLLTGIIGAAGDFLLRYWELHRWQNGRRNGCARCGGPTLDILYKNRPAERCLACNWSIRY
jgi:hypothetical protein